MGNDDITLEPHNLDWSVKAKAEIELIKAKCNFVWIEGIEHFGSTAIKNISAKPVLDIIIGVENIEKAREFIPILKSIGYIFWRENPKKDRLFFVKGIPPYGKKRTHHIHIFEKLHYEWHARRLFRDYLNEHEDLAAQYESLKINLANKYSEDREGYTEAKTDFVRNVIQEAIIPYISFEHLKINDLSSIHRWLSNDRIAKWWGNDQLSLEQIKDKYSSYIEGYKIEAKNKKPIHSYVIKIWQQNVGYIQYYRASDFARDGYALKNVKKLSNNLAAIDFYIGEESFTGKGLGSVILNKFLLEFIDHEYDYCLVDPDLANQSAICSYERSGFEQFEILANLNIMIMIRNNHTKLIQN